MPAAESYPDDLRYHREHDWARVDGDTATFGVTWYAQDSLGDLVVYLPPEVGAEVTAGARVRRARVGQGRLRHRRAALGHRDRGQPGRDRRARARQRRSLRPGLADPRAAVGPGRARRPARRGRLLGAHGGPVAMARLSELERAVPFSRRHIGPSPEDQERMLALLGHASLDELARAAVPASILLGSDLDLPEALPEIDVLAELRELGHRNRVMTTMIGLGYYGTHTPQVVLRKVLENPAWYTAYTPYQPEISQGRLEALLNYQTMVCDLTGLPRRERVAARRGHGGGRGDDGRAARRRRPPSQPLRRRPRRLPADARDAADARRAARHRGRRRRPRRRACPTGGCFGVLAQYPGASGARARPRAAGRGGARRAARSPASPPTCSRSSCSSRPGEMGADVVVGTSQRFGVPIGFGGPHAAYMSVRSGLERALPGPPRRRSRSTPTAIRRCGSRCRRASSTSAARRRPRTSARRRCCSP